MDDETLRRYVDKYKAGGVESLVETNHKGRECRPSEKQLNFLQKELDNNIYLTTDSIIEQQLIVAKHSVPHALLLPRE